MAVTKVREKVGPAKHGSDPERSARTAPQQQSHFDRRMNHPEIDLIFPQKITSASLPVFLKEREIERS
jgi:hypothetical protein